MNKKLKSIIREETRTEKQIEDLQEHLKEVRIRRKQIEDDAILRSIRSLKLDRGSLFDLLNGIQEGNIDMMALIADEDEYDEPDEETDSNDEDDTDHSDLADALNKAYQYGAASADEEGSDDYEE